MVKILTFVLEAVLCSISSVIELLQCLRMFEAILVF